MLEGRVVTSHNYESRGISSRHLSTYSLGYQSPISICAPALLTSDQSTNSQHPSQILGLPRWLRW